MQELNVKLNGVLPNWIIELFSKHPIAEAQIEYPLNEADEEDDGYFPIQIASLVNLYDETMLIYPGIAIKDLGYFCIATELAGSGDQFFISNKMGDNPPVFQVYHDVSDVAEEIERKGMEKIAESLSEFFQKTRIIDYW